jgi:uncharacterized protein YerC
MAHVSKQDLPKEVRKQIEEQLVQVFFGRKHTTTGVFEELVTEVETIMLAKRLAAILMLINEQSYYRIQQALGMSTSTSKRLHKMLMGGSFSALERRASDKKGREELFAKIEMLLRAGLPPRAYIIKKRRT